MRPYFTLHSQIMGHNTFSIIKGIWKSSVTRNLALNIEYLQRNSTSTLQTGVRFHWNISCCAVIWAVCRQAAWVYGKIISIVSRNLVLLVTTECDCVEDVVSSGHISSGRMSAALLLPYHLELSTNIRGVWQCPHKNQLRHYAKLHLNTISRCEDAWL